MSSTNYQQTIISFPTFVLLTFIFLNGVVQLNAHLCYNMHSHVPNTQRDDWEIRNCSVVHPVLDKFKQSSGCFVTSGCLRDDFEERGCAPLELNSDVVMIAKEIYAELEPKTNPAYAVPDKITAANYCDMLKALLGCTKCRVCHTDLCNDLPEEEIDLSSSQTEITSSTIGAHSSTIGATSSTIGATSSTIGAHSSTIGAHSSTIGAHSSTIGATSSTIEASSSTTEATSGATTSFGQLLPSALTLGLGMAIFSHTTSRIVLG